MLKKCDETFCLFKVRKEILKLFSLCVLTRSLSVLHPINTNMAKENPFIYTIDSSTFFFFSKNFAVFCVFWANYVRTRGNLTTNVQDLPPAIPPITPAHSRVKSAILRGNGNKVKRQIENLHRARRCRTDFYANLIFRKWTTIHSIEPIVPDDVISI